MPVSEKPRRRKTGKPSHRGIAYLEMLPDGRNRTDVGPMQYVQAPWLIETNMRNHLSCLKTKSQFRKSVARTAVASALAMLETITITRLSLLWYNKKLAV